MRTLQEKTALFENSDIYPVVSSEFCNGRSVPDIVFDIACGGAKIVQIREKNLSDSAVFELVKTCKIITDKYEMLLIVDDRVDIAMAVGADGVHLGQDDFPLSEAKRLAPEMLFGVSTHNADEIRKVCGENGVTIEGDALLATVMRMPDVVTNDDAEASTEEYEAIMSAAADAVAQLDAFRIQEGAILIADLLKRIDLIEQYRHDVEPYESARVEVIKSRIRENLQKLAVEVDNNRLEQEMIFYIEKLDITEEKVRLDNHCNYFREVAAEEDAPGRKLGFIAQELGREINTMGSKSNEANMQRLVVKMKDELEKIKEQVLNIL